MAIIQTVLEALDQEVTVVDLLADGYNPTTTTEDLYNWSHDKFSDKLSERYYRMIKEADLVVFPYPVWWGSMPAVLKGFFDKVLLPGEAYVYGEHGEMIGQLTGKKAVVITTMEASLTVMQNVFQDCDHNITCKVILETCGFEVLKHFQFEKIVSSTMKDRQQMLKDIEDFFKTLK